ncbi:MAG: trypsin-like peptidase domain-containing protein, partial [Sedimentisphaerales bacterium]|nr:trypsin-like peptidase domain-containing protein [Sedimentisphaerales bacterium]
MKLEGISSGNPRLVFFVVLLSFLTGSFLTEDSAFGSDEKQRIEKVAAKELLKRDSIKRDSIKRSGKYVEMEIFLGEELSLADIASLPMAPGSEVEIIAGGKRAKVQVPSYVAEAVLGSGVKAFVRRKFILFEGGEKLAMEPEGDLVVDSTCTDPDYCFGSNSSYVPIPDDGYDGEWAYSDISISCAGSGDIVCSIDVHYEIIHTWISDLIVAVSDYSMTNLHWLWYYEGGSGEDISETETGITAFYGLTVNQIWTLWATDDVGGDWGYIDYWWIKVYYGSNGTSPDNDDCMDAIAVTEDVPYFGSSVGATTDDTSSCGGSADVWHKFTPSESGNYTISLKDSGFDTTLAVFNHCGGTELACNDDTPTSLQSELQIDLTAGNTYYIRVAGYDGATGSYKLLVGGCTAPVNDDCADAIGVVTDVVYNGSTECATGSYVSNCSDGDTADVWHSYIPDSNETVIISLAGSSFDTTLSVFDGCGGTELACNDDSSEGLTSGTYTSAIAMDMYGGTTYVIRVAGYFGETGDYSLIINRQCLVPLQAQEPVPANDACDVPLDIVLSWDGGGGGLKAISYSKIPEETIVPKVIYGEDDRLDEYDVSNPAILAIGDSTVAILSVGALWDNGDGTFDLPPETFAEYFLSMYGDPLCFDEPFRDQPNPAWCSGFLVAPDIIATAGHCAYPSDCGELAFVFGFVMMDATTPRLTINSSEIYYCSEIIEQQGISDWALVRLDRPVVGHEPLPIRNSGIVPVDDPLLVIGHPVGLPRKYDDGGTVRSTNPLSPYF